MPLPNEKLIIIITSTYYTIIQKKYAWYFLSTLTKLIINLLQRIFLTITKKLNSSDCISMSLTFCLSCLKKKLLNISTFANEIAPQQIFNELRTCMGFYADLAELPFLLLSGIGNRFPRNIPKSHLQGDINQNGSYLQ